MFIKKGAFNYMNIEDNKIGNNKEDKSNSLNEEEIKALSKDIKILEEEKIIS